MEVKYHVDVSAGARNAGARNAVARNAVARNAGARNAGARNAGARNAGARNAGARNAGARNAGARNAGARNAGARNAGAECQRRRRCAGLHVEGNVRLTLLPGKRSATRSLQADCLYHDGCWIQFLLPRGVQPCKSW
jgi:hypothetical protein